MKPGDGLLHPLAWGSLVVLLVNDHVLKRAYPSWLTGKLSDVAGLVFFPLLLEAVVELGSARAKRLRSAVPLAVAVVATGIVFTLAKTSPLVNGWVKAADAVLRYPLRLAVETLHGKPFPRLGHPRMVLDATDLFALPALLVSLRIGLGRHRRARAVGQCSSVVQASST